MNLNKEQLAAAHYDGDKNLLIIAGAGTGKTKTIISRVVYLVNSGVDPDRILLLTFTRKAAHEMVSRLKDELGGVADKILASTFHSFCLMAIRSNSQMFNMDDKIIIDGEDQNSLMTIAKKDMIPSEKSKTFPKSSELVSIFSYARNVNMNHTEYLKKYLYMTDDRADIVSDVFERYTHLKRQNNYLDFDDILYLFNQTLAKNDHIKNAFKALFDHILVDEMQDTNPIQWSILKNLYNPAKLFCVGDDAQSIYKFRGADFESIHSFESHIDNSTVMRLIVNYRSSQEILDVSNKLLKESTLDYNKTLVSAKGKNKIPVGHRIFQDPFDEANYVVDLINKNKEKGDRLNDHLILVRSSFAAKPLQFILTKNKIPFEMIGGINIFQASHVKDVMALLRIYANIKDDLSWCRYLELFPRMGKTSANKHVDKLKKLDTFQKAIGYLARNVSPFKVHEILDKMVQQKNVHDMIVHIYTNLSPMLQNIYDDWDSRALDFDMLISMSVGYTEVKDFLDDFTLDPGSTKGSTDDKVTVSTIHAAKGTERKHGILIQSQPGVIPSTRSMESPDDLEEERRIMYVALTRAKTSLHITRISPQPSGRVPPIQLRKMDFLSFLFDTFHRRW